MGCVTSKQVPSGTEVTAVGSTERNLARKEQRQKTGQPNSKKEDEERAPPRLDSSGRLTSEEIVFRTARSKMTKSITVGSLEFPIQIEYACWSQRGYYPEDPFKENQDDLAVTFPFAGDARSVAFDVFDGHGKKGHACARYAKRHLPRLADKYIRRERVKKYRSELTLQGNLKGAKLYDPGKWPQLSLEEFEDCYRRAYLDCNNEMQESTKVEANLSGTTAVSVSIHGNSITICNVGDSRAVLGHRTDKKENRDGKKNADENETDCHLLAMPLTRDQTPYRKDERERVRKSGAVVMSIDQLEGHEAIHDNFGDMVLGGDVDLHGDPPRVWVKGKNYPGCAFTRSLGDELGESIGIFAEPETISRELTVNDEVLVIATDGIFEFLTNQEVLDMSLQCGSPLKACECLVKAAYEQWLFYERRTDDITIIVCFMQCTRPIPDEGRSGTTEDLVDMTDTAYGTKPFRRPRGENDVLCCSNPEIRSNLSDN